MSDLFHDEVFDMPSPFGLGLNYRLDSFIPYTDYPMLDAIFTVMERCPRHVFMLLTKRPENMKCYFNAVQRHKIEYADKFKDCPTEAMQNSPAAREAQRSAQRPIPKNIWAGTTVEHPFYYARINELSDVPAMVRFVSVEPMLSYINLDRWIYTGRLDWVICGAQTGPGAQPMKLEWARELRDHCQKAGVPFFFKSAGDNKPIPNDLMIREYPKLYKGAKNDQRISME